MEVQVVNDTRVTLLLDADERRVLKDATRDRESYIREYGSSYPLASRYLDVAEEVEAHADGEVSLYLGDVILAKEALSWSRRQTANQDDVDADEVALRERVATELVTIEESLVYGNSPEKKER